MLVSRFFHQLLYVLILLLHSLGFAQGSPEIKGIWSIPDATTRGRPSYLVVSETGPQFLIIVLDASGIGWEALLGFREGNNANTCTVVSEVSACFRIEIISAIRIKAVVESCTPVEDCMWTEGESFFVNRIF